MLGFFAFGDAGGGAAALRRVLLVSDEQSFVLRVRYRGLL